MNTHEQQKQAKQAKAIELLTAKGIPKENIHFGEQEVTVMIQRRKGITYNYWHFGEKKSDRIKRIWYFNGKYQAPQNIGSLNY